MKDGFDTALERITDSSVKRRVRMEQKMVRALVDACLDRNFLISVNDGDSYVVSSSADRPTIRAALFSMDEDFLLIRDPVTRDNLGWFSLIYGNDGWDVVSNYSDNDICNEIWNSILRPLSDKLEEGLA